MRMGKTASKLSKAAKQLLLATSRSLSLLHSPRLRGSTATKKHNNSSLPHPHDEATDTCSSTSTRILCSICLEPLSNCEAIFTGQCSHSFHFSCIASNVRHGSVTCPVCRALWTHLPFSSFTHPSRRLQDNPVFRILDGSNVHRCSFLRSARYDDDELIDPPLLTNYPRLNFSLIPLTVSPKLVSYQCCLRSLHLHQSAYSYSPLYGLDTDHDHLASPFLPLQPEVCHCLCTLFGKRYAYLSVKLANLQPIDLILVVSPSESHLRLVKQAMVSVTLSLQPVDRVAIVCVTARVFALRRMTSCGKQAALRVIDRLFCLGQTDPSQGIRKGIKVLKDRAYKNPQCSILHITSGPIRSYYPSSMMQMGVMVHRFEVETWNWFVMHKLKERVLGGIARDIHVRMGIEGKVVKIGELRGGEERRVLVEVGVHANVGVSYSYVEGDNDECMRIRGEEAAELW